MERKTVIVTLKPVTFVLPEHWTDEHVSEFIERQYSSGQASGWKYEDEWRN